MLAMVSEGASSSPTPAKQQVASVVARPSNTSSSPTTAKKQLASVVARPSNKIVVPPTLSSKEAKKFRKNERRKVRLEGRDESKLVFATPGQQPTSTARASSEATEEPPRKKRKREYPRINELVEKAKVEKEKNSAVLARQKEDAELPEAYKKRFVALDCEMVGIGSSGKQSALARVSLVDWNGSTLLDTFVQVPDRVEDFRTHVSGVTPKHLKSAMSVHTCRQTVADLIRDKILVGHALSNDLKVLMMTHPPRMTRDTARYRPLQRLGGNKWRPRKLRDLVKEHVDLTIQEEGKSHDSVEDAKATMELFKVVRSEWEATLQEAEARKSKKKAVKL